MKQIGFINIWILLLCMACNEPEIIIPPFEPIISDKVVLVEEVTGVRCPNCPSGSAKIESLLEQFPGQVIAVGIHGSFLTIPYSDSKFDFRHEFGIELENYLKPWEGKPSAYVNRTKFDEEPLISISEFDLLPTYVSQILQEEHQLEISIDTDYDPSTRELEVNLGMIPLADLSGEFRLHVMITENHIIDKQANVGEILDVYEHNHVLRTMLTAFDGDPFANALTRNDLINNRFSFTIPNEEGIWLAENLEVVAFVSDNSDDLREVLQAAIAPVIVE